MKIYRSWSLTLLSATMSSSVSIHFYFYFCRKNRNFIQRLIKLHCHMWALCSLLAFFMLGSVKKVDLLIPVIVYQCHWFCLIYANIIHIQKINCKSKIKLDGCGLVFCHRNIYKWPVVEMISPIRLFFFYMFPETSYGLIASFEYLVASMFLSL